jgi:hypothetical protein
MVSMLREIPRVGDFVTTRYGGGVIVGRYSNWTTEGLIVDIRGVNHYLAEESVIVCRTMAVQVRRAA